MSGPGLSPLSSASSAMGHASPSGPAASPSSPSSRSSLAAHRRPLATAAAAGGLLLALWFVPSANAAPDGPDDPAPGAPHSRVHHNDPDGPHGATAAEDDGRDRDAALHRGTAASDAH
ncbi:hypothetical protein [Streptomyces cacaoi]|uniref:hypothetical protein n=1 Tax=Streptomyces cacaoi TaxID=1898 RepID=UPI0037498E3E